MTFKDERKEPKEKKEIQFPFLISFLVTVSVSPGLFLGYVWVNPNITHGFLLFE